MKVRGVNGRGGEGIGVRETGGCEFFEFFGFFLCLRGLSLRLTLREFISLNGYSDYVCMAVS